MEYENINKVILKLILIYFGWLVYKYVWLNLVNWVCICKYIFFNCIEYLWFYKLIL